MENTGDDKPSTESPGTQASKLDQHVRERSTWLRLLYLLVFCFIYALTRFVVFAVVVLQFFWLLFSGEVNPRLTAAGQSLANYTYQLVCYLTFASDVRPFPVDEDWPSTTPL